jgi:ABC-type polysaccharide/polyol phosphate export permease
MTGVVEAFRGGVLHGELKGGWLFPASAAIALILLATGLRHFRRTERSFADVV